VRLNGRLYEALVARLEKRQSRALYHSALVVTIPAGKFVIEQAWPIPDATEPGAASSLKAGREPLDGFAAGLPLRGPTLARR
jgi:hypothetical protein